MNICPIKYIYFNIILLVLFVIIYCCRNSFIFYLLQQHKGNVIKLYYNLEIFNCYIENVYDDHINCVLFDKNLKNISRNKINKNFIRYEVIWFRRNNEEEVLYKTRYEL